MCIKYYQREICLIWHQLINNWLYRVISWYRAFGRDHRRMINTEEKGKGRRCWLGDDLECCTNRHLAAMMTWRKVFERTSILGGWWIGVSSVNQMIFHFSKHPLRQVAIFLSILSFKSSWCKKASAASNLINSFPWAAATTFAFPFWIYPSSMTVTYTAGHGGTPTEPAPTPAGPGRYQTPRIPRCFIAGFLSFGTAPAPGIFNPETAPAPGKREQKFGFF